MDRFLFTIPTMFNMFHRVSYGKNHTSYITGLKSISKIPVFPLMYYCSSEDFLLSDSGLIFPSEATMASLVEGTIYRNDRFKSFNGPLVIKMSTRDYLRTKVTLELYGGIEKVQQVKDKNIIYWTIENPVKKVNFSEFQNQSVQTKPYLLKDIIANIAKLEQYA